MTDEISWKDLAAIWGGATGTIALCWNIFVGLRDRAALKIRADVREVHRPGSAGPTKLVLFVAVSNRGRRPITISSFSWETEQGKGSTFLVDPMQVATLEDPYEQIFWKNATPSLPQVLAESQAVSFYLPVSVFAESGMRNIRLVDSHGDFHRLPRWRAKKLRLAVMSAVQEARGRTADAS